MKGETGIILADEKSDLDEDEVARGEVRRGRHRLREHAVDRDRPRPWNGEGLDGGRDGRDADEREGLLRHLAQHEPQRG